MTFTRIEPKAEYQWVYSKKITGYSASRDNFKYVWRETPGKYTSIVRFLQPNLIFR